jgi:hypothetical protein
MRYCCALMVTVGLMSGVAMGELVDDFESYTLGSFPGGVWEDARNYVNGSTHTGDSASVIQTLDAHGNTTNAVQILDHVGTSGGLVSRVGRADVQRMEVDVRLDQFGDGDVPSWMSAVGFYQELDGHDLNGMPQAMVWASRNGRFRLFVHNSDGQATSADTYGLGNLSWELDTWYRIAIEADTLNGIFNVQITDLESGDLLRDITRQINGWNPEFGQYNLISMNDGEYGSPPGSIANMATFDNARYIPTPGVMSMLGCAGLLASRRRR